MATLAPMTPTTTTGPGPGSSSRWRDPAVRGHAARDDRDLAEPGSTRRYRRNTYLFHQGDQSPEVFFLLVGAGGDQLGLGERPPAAPHDDRGAPVLRRARRPGRDAEDRGGALALEESEVWRAEATEFLDFLPDDPSASRALLRALSRQVQSQEAFVDDLLYLDLKGRVAKRLLQLVSPSLDELPEDGAVVPSIVTHADLASLCGGSRENVTRILSDFQRRGFVERQGRRFVLLKISGARSSPACRSP